jgi:hypothetical protein
VIRPENAFAPITIYHLAAAPIADTWQPILPATSDAPRLTMDFFNRFAPKGYTFACGWRYRDAEGQLLGFIVRFDRPANGLPAAKQFRPFTFCSGPAGRREWRCQGFPEPRPLYGLNRLAPSPLAQVLVAEGERAADAASKRFPNYVVVTSSYGAKAARKTDWTPLAGRRVVIWPDADEPGAQYGQEVAAILLRVGAASIHSVIVPATFPSNWDLSDALPTGVTDTDLSRLLAEAKPIVGAEGGPRWPPIMPITSTLPPVEPFMPELLPPVIRDYVLDVADRQQAPPDFAAVAALCGLAAVVGNRVRIRPKQNDDWEVVPNLWGAIIGRPSAMKSPAMQAALAPVYAIQDELRKEYEEGVKAAKINAALSNLDAKNAHKKADEAVKNGDREGARGLLARMAEDDEEPTCPRIVVNDVTVEKLGELLNENPRGLLLIRDELPGFLARLENQEHQSERAFYLEAFNGNGSFTYDRIGRGTVHIENSTVSIIGGVQPARIAPIVRGAISGVSNDGLIQRLQMAVWPDDVRSWKWVDRQPNKEARQAYEKVYRDLFNLSMGDTQKPAVLHFSPEGQALFQQWMTENQNKARSGSVSSAVESHMLKMPKTVAALALLFELIEGGRFEVNELAMRTAIGWAEYLLSHATRLYSVGDTMAADGARLIIERRKQLPAPFTLRDIQRKGWASLGDRDIIMSAIDVLLETHHGREVPQAINATNHTGGRPTAASYEWNPSLPVEG